MSSEDASMVLSAKAPTLAGWLLRDLLLVLVFVLLCSLTWFLQQAFHNDVTAAFAAVTGFVCAYATCYMVHEWGHYLGARLAGRVMPLCAYNSALLGRFEIEKYSLPQYLALSWGGVLGYTLVAGLALLLWQYLPGLPGSAIALGGVAFVLQSWSVDLPIIFRVTAGADMVSTASAGTSPGLIVRKTLVVWSGLAVLVFLMR